MPVNLWAQKYTYLPNFGFIVYLAASLPTKRGDRTSSRFAGGVAVDAGGVGAGGGRRAGCARERGASRDEQSVRQNRVVPAVVATDKPCGAANPTGPAVPSIGKVTVTKGARHKPSDHCAGKAGLFPASLYAAVHCVCTSFAQWTAGASRRPAFPAPSLFARGKSKAKLGRFVPRECRRMSAVVRSMSRRSDAATHAGKDEVCFCRDDCKGMRRPLPSRDGDCHAPPYLARYAPANIRVALSMTVAMRSSDGAGAAWNTNGRKSWALHNSMNWDAASSQSSIARSPVAT